MNGGWLLYFLGMSYTFICIALVCAGHQSDLGKNRHDPWRSRGDHHGCGRLRAWAVHIPHWYIHQSLHVGFGTIVGSAVFNVLFVIGCCAIFTPGHLPLTWWPFAWDCLYYILSLTTLAIFYGVNSPDIIEWYEAVILLLMYVGYATLMFNNQRIHRFLFEKVLKQDMPVSDTANHEIELGMNGNTNNLSTPVSGMGPIKSYKLAWKCTPVLYTVPSMMEVRGHTHRGQDQRRGKGHFRQFGNRQQWLVIIIDSHHSFDCAYAVSRAMERSDDG